MDGKSDKKAGGKPSKSQQREERGFVFNLMDQLENNSNIHRELVALLEKDLGSNIVVYHANMGHPVSLMLPNEASLLDNLLSTLDRSAFQNRLDLFIHSPGGLPETAARMAQIARAYSSSFRIVVPERCMSAATLLAMGADEIVMSDSSQLGPIDPQMQTIDQNGRPVRRSAKSFIDAYSGLINNAHSAIAGGQPAHAFLTLLNHQDPSWIMECTQARNATTNLAVELLKGNMLKDKSDAEIQAVVDKFVAAGDEGTHGNPIFWKKAREYGLRVSYQDKEGETWKKVRELFVRLDHYINNKRTAKYLLCRMGGLDVNIQVVS